MDVIFICYIIRSAEFKRQLILVFGRFDMLLKRSRSLLYDRCIDIGRYEEYIDLIQAVLQRTCDTIFVSTLIT